MKPTSWLLLSLLPLAAMGAPHASVTGAVPDGVRAPLSFERNDGQADAGTRFVSRGAGYTLALAPQHATLRLRAGHRRTDVRLSFVGGGASTLVAEERREQVSHYLVGDRRDWRTNVPHYGRVRYRSVYPGVDAVFYGRDQQLEYDFVVAPGSDPSVIAMQFDGVRRLHLDESGSLLLDCPGGTLRQPAPVVYQEHGGRRQTVAGRYVVQGANRVGFALGAYDRTRPLVIDPLLVYSSYLGGDRHEIVHAVTIDAEGNTYLAGETLSQDFPRAGGFNNSQVFKAAAPWAFVTKMNAAGDKVLWSVFLGNDVNTRAQAVAVDGEGNVYVAGMTDGTAIPLQNPVQGQRVRGAAAFVCKLSPDASKLLFSTYLDGERDEHALAIAVDAAQNLYVTGLTGSQQFPTLNAFQEKHGGNTDVFLTKFAAPDYRLAYSTFLGGAAYDEAYAMTLDADGAVYLTGTFATRDFGTEGAFQPKGGFYNNAFVAKVKPEGAGLAFLTYLSGDDADHGYGIALDGAGNIWVVGGTASLNFPVTANAMQPKRQGTTDAFVARLDPTGSTLLYGTYLGGTVRGPSGSDEEAHGIMFDSRGNAWITGQTNSPDFPVVRAIQPQFGGGVLDAFAIKLNPQGDRVIFSTFLGGEGDDKGRALALHGNTAHLAGQAGSLSLPLKDALQTARKSTTDGFMARVCDPWLSATPGELVFTHTQGALMPEEQTFAVGVGCPQVNWTLTVTSDNWLRATPEQGEKDGTVAVAVSAGDLAPGEYRGTLTITAPDAEQPTLEVPVKLNVAAKEE